MENKGKVINFRWEKLKHDAKQLLNLLKQILECIFNREKKSTAYRKNSSKGYRKMQGKRKI